MADGDLLRGVLEPIVLDAVGRGATYGYDIARAVFDRSQGKVVAQEGTLYPALHRLERDGLLAASWGESPEGRKRKHYKLTASGRKRLAAFREQWTDFSATVSQLLGLAHAAR